MHVAELWRYPVKSLRGERIEAADVELEGFAGDRLVHVRDGRDRLVTARTKPRLLGLRAEWDADGGTRVEGAAWDAPAASAALRRVAGDEARFVADTTLDRFDDTAVLIATDGAIAALGIDGRRLRPNIVVAGVPGLAEHAWPGRTLRAGEIEISVEKVCQRCVITTLDPDTCARDPSVLRRIDAEHDGRFALNCWVARGGSVRAGDVVEVS